MNQKLEQYLWFFMDYRQKNWPEWLVLAEFAINNKVHSVTKVSLFIANHRRELRMGADIRRKRKVEKAIEFVERMSLGEGSYQESIQWRCCMGGTMESLRKNIWESWRGTGENGSQFLQRRNLEERIMSKLKANLGLGLE